MERLVREVALRSGMPDDAAEQCVEAVVTALCDVLAEEGVVRVGGLGTFEARRRAPRTCRNPRTGARMTVPARSHVAFRPTPTLLGRLDQVS
jgi:nucleoid DNA-binding protein